MDWISFKLTYNDHNQWFSTIFGIDVKQLLFGGSNGTRMKSYLGYVTY